MRFGAIIAALALAASPAAAAERLALVIGNADYQRTAALQSPARDAAAMKRMLETVGFDVTLVQNADHAAMRRALRDFAERSRGADTALLYYSGHGMEIAERNYLIPVDAALRHPDDAGFEAIALEQAMTAAAGATRLSVVVVDACRNNSFPSVAKSAPKGFKATRARAGQVVAFATAPGEVALDGGGALSPYTAALIETLRRDPAMDVRVLFTSLGARTSELAGAQQEPFARFGRFGAATAALAPAAAADARLAAPAAKQDRAGWDLQVAAAESLQEARELWAALRRRLPELQGLRAYAQPVKIGQTQLFRLRLGRYETRRDASDMCKALRSKSVDCFPTTHDATKPAIDISPR